MSAIYTTASVAPLLASLKPLLSSWGLSEQTELRLLTLSENATFIAEDPLRDNPLILRAHRPQYHRRDEIESEIHWLLNLRATDTVNTPAIVPTHGGSYVATFTCDNQERYAVAFEFMAGKEPSADQSLIEGFEQLGLISAQLHSHAQHWALPAGFSRKVWDFNSAFGSEPLWGDWRSALGLTASGKKILEDTCVVLEKKLQQYGKDSDRFGLVHADLRLANLLVHQESLGVIDFDDCGFSWYMYDFASAVSFHELNPMLPDLQAAWLKGYQQARALSPTDQAMLPTFIMFRRLLLTAWIASHSETETAQEAGHEAYTEGTILLAQQYLKEHQ